MTEVEVAVVGGGVVGLAIAYELSKEYSSVVLFEKESRVGEGISSRNSGVIHSGVNDPVGSLKSILCVEGNILIYEMADSFRIPHKRLGKVMVATNNIEVAILEEVKSRGESNGAELHWLDNEELRKREPNVNGIVALYSPNTGIISTPDLINCLRSLFQQNGGVVLTNTEVTSVSQVGDSFEIHSNTRGSLEVRVVVNSAGLYADEIGRMLGYCEHTIYPCRGEYFELTPSKSGVVNGLVYPVKMKGAPGLGVHFTKNIAGNVLLGPNAVYVERKDDYTSGRESAESFLTSARKLVPSISIQDLRESYSGIRPKLTRLGEPWSDFVIVNNKPFPNVVHLLGIESPGLTAAPAIGRYVKKMVDEVLK